MKRFRNIVMLLCLFITMTAFISLADDGDGSLNSWEPGDFTYGEYVLSTDPTVLSPAVYPGDDFKSYLLPGTKWVVTGFSEAGAEKLKSGNTDLIIPSSDPDGRTVQGVGKNAFKASSNAAIKESGKRITSVKFPWGVMTSDNIADVNSIWGNKGYLGRGELTEIGDFFVGYGAFDGNDIKSLKLPKGTLLVDTYAFARNSSLSKVSIPSTAAIIGQGAFFNCSISDVTFAASTDIRLNIYQQAFASNKIASVYLPENTLKVGKWAFLQNTGSGVSVEEGTAVEQKGEVVTMYMKGEPTDMFLTPNIQKTEQIDEYPAVDPSNDPDSKEGTADESEEQGDPDEPDEPGEPENPGDQEDPETEDSAWTASDFTYTDYSQRLYGCDYSRDFTISGKAISGFSESGLLKLENNKNLVLPAETDEGEPLVGVAKEAFYEKGIQSVKFPTGMYARYDDELTNYITERGNFVIAENSFAKNELTELRLPDGVIAVMSNAFYGNQLTTVTLPKTIWWVETQSFARNQISKVNFPERTWFMFEMHGNAFANNQIKSVKLPSTTAVANKMTFMLNPGMEALPEEAAANMSEAAYENSGVVYMYTDSADAWDLDRIHHIEKTTASTKSWFQKLIINDGSAETQYADSDAWNVNDFTYDGTTVTGLSESGAEKRKINHDLIIPDVNDEGLAVTEIADADASEGGLFATSEEKFNSVTLPSELKIIGDNAFREAGLTELALPPELVEIGQSAFVMNSIETVILPDTVKKMGDGAFATNASLRRIVLSKGLKEIPRAAFACSDAKHWMKDLTSIDIPEGVTSIGDRAFAGNNFRSINIPEGVTSIGEYAFSTKNYLMYDDIECTLTLPDSLTTIGKRAFRNKLIAEVDLPESVSALHELTFEKMLSTYGTPDVPGSTPQGMVTQVYVRSKEQFNDRENFPESEFHKLILDDYGTWIEEDFEYGKWQIPEGKLYLRDEKDDSLAPEVWVVTGLSARGKEKLAHNQHLVIPSKDPEGRTVQGVGDSAFEGSKIESECGCNIRSLTLPEGIMAENEMTAWNSNLTERGDFFIADNAFANNDINSLDLPQGVIFAGDSAFADNELFHVSFPASITRVGENAFKSNQIGTISLPAEVDFSFNAGNGAFADNMIRSVQLPENTGAIGEKKSDSELSTVFADNTGVEPASGGSEGGVVYLYKETSAGSDLIYNTENKGSAVQKLVIGNIPEEESPWNVSDFAFDESGKTVTGLSDSGKTKIKVNQDLILPDRGPSGETVTAIGDGVMGTLDKEQIGTFGIREEDKPYVPVRVRFPSELETIGNNAFSAYIDAETGNMTGLTEAVFPDTLVKIGNTAFQNAPLRSIILPDSVEEIGNGAFTGTIYASEIVLSDSLNEIPAGAFVKTNNSVPFVNMATVDSLVIPAGVTSVGNNAFQGNKIKNLVLQEGLQTIGSNAFNNSQLTGLTIPGTVQSIGNSAFAVQNETLLKTLKSLAFGEGFNGKVGSNVFRGHALTMVELPETCAFSNFHADAFYDAEMKVRLITSSEAEAANFNALPMHTSYTYVVEYSKLAGTGWSEGDFTYDGPAITGFSESGIEEFGRNKVLVLPDEAPDGTLITEIADEAFAIPEDQVDIGKYDANSDGITSVDLPSGLVRIGSRAFEYNMLTKIDLESLENIQEIGESAFHGNHLASVKLPDTVVRLGEGAFAMNSITSLRLSRNVTKIPQGAFSMNIRLSAIEIPDTVTEIGDMAFAGARLTELTIPKSVVKIDRKAFHLHHLETLTIPGNVKEIGESAFEGTYKEQTLMELTLEEGIESIGKYAFKEGLLTSVRLPVSLKTIGAEPFANNTGSGSDHTVTLITCNPDQLSFNDDGITSHNVVLANDMIMLDPKGGTVDPAYVKLDSDGRIDGKLPVPVGESVCHEFAGWYIEGTDGEAVTASRVFEAGTVIYARWKENHIWDNGVVTKEPTETEEGVMLYTCINDPSHQYTVAIPVIQGDPETARANALEALEKSIIYANSCLASGEYTTESYTALVYAIEEANEYCDDPQSDTSHLLLAERAVTKAVRRLKPVDKAAAAAESARAEALEKLAKNIISAKQVKNNGTYKTSSFKTFETARANANKVLDSETADESVINKANLSLLKAWRNLSEKDKQTIKASGKKVKIKAKRLKKKTYKIPVKKAVKVSKAVGTRSYSICKVYRSKYRKYFSINSKTGKISVKKGLKKGKYKVTVRVRAAGNDNIAAGYKDVVVKVRVK